MTITWVSPNIDVYINSVNKALEDFHLAMKRADDIVKYRIEAVLAEIANTLLCEINDDPILIDEFYKHTEELCNRSCINLQIKSKNVEDAVHELIEILYLVDDADDFEEEQEVNDDNLDDHAIKAISIKTGSGKLHHYFDVSYQNRNLHRFL
jgi:dynein heavy chain